MPSFSLQFDSAKIQGLSDSYEYEDDADARKAGERISQGEYTRAHLEKIYHWKTGGRGVSRLGKNTDEEIADALALAARAKTERSAVAVLCGLAGVDIPVASAVLTAMNPERYTIVDFRALESLGVTPRPVLTMSYYLEYLDKCRELAKQHRVSLRVLDRALWQWSKEQRDSRAE